MIKDGQFFVREARVDMGLYDSTLPCVTKINIACSVLGPQEHIEMIADSRLECVSTRFWSNHTHHALAGGGVALPGATPRRHAGSGCRRSASGRRVCPF